MIYFLQTVVDSLSLGSLYALAALGIGLLFGILRLVNFAHGDFITVGVYSLIIPSLSATATMMIGAWPWPLLIIAVAVVVMAFALASDTIVFRHLRQSNPASLMIASFAVGYVIQNLILLLYGARPKAINLWPGLSYIVQIGPLRIPLLQLVVIGAAISLLVALVAFMRYTRFGLQMRAASENFQMARYLGVRANFVIGLAFALSGLLAAAVSILLLAQTGTVTPQFGSGVLAIAFVATVVGGMGSLVGSVLGGFVVGAISIFLQSYLPAEIRVFRDAFLFGLVILLLLFRPNGLVRIKANEERV